MSLDIERLRAQTQGTRHVTFFNSAGASLPPDVVHDAVTSHLELERVYGGYEAARQADAAIEAMYDTLAALIGASRDEIAYVENATRAWDMAFYAIPFRSGDRILTARSEYASNFIAYLQMARSRGVRIDVVPDDAHGQIDVAALDAMIDPSVRLIALSHVPSQSGLVQPVEAVGQIARRHGILYLVDACQSVGQLPVDVEAIGCDMLSATGRKFLRGPRGTGFLYVRRARIAELEPPFLDLHAAEWTGPDSYRVRADARRFENWESYVAGRLGLAAAARLACELGLDAIATRVTRLAEGLRAGLRAIDGVSVHDRGEHLCGIVTFTKAGLPALSLEQHLRAQGILASVTSRSTAQLDLGSRGLDALVRASVHYFNRDDEVDRLVAAVAAL